eukprot:2401154-Amphidinium_carterae.1
MTTMFLLCPKPPSLLVQQELARTTAEAALKEVRIRIQIWVAYVRDVKLCSHSCLGLIITKSLGVFYLKHSVGYYQKDIKVCLPNCAQPMNERKPASNCWYLLIHQLGSPNTSESWLMHLALGKAAWRRCARWNSRFAGAAEPSAFRDGINRRKQA